MDATGLGRHFRAQANVQPQVRSPWEALRIAGSAHRARRRTRWRTPCAAGNGHGRGLGAAGAHRHSTVRRPHSRAPRVVEGRRSVRGRQLSFGAPRPARRLRRVQQRSAAADLCVSASTQLCGVVAHHLPIRTHGLPSHTHPRALHDLRPASYQTSASASEGVVAKSVYFSFTGSVRRRRRRRAKSKALGRKRAGWLTRSGSQPSTGLWAQAEGDKEGSSVRSRN